jgi:Domain of unknown function (DUF4160)
MPVISAFFGIVIRMYYREHDPPHFHAEHQGDHATFTFDGALADGSIRSATARRRVEQWANLHRRELEANWASMKTGRPLERIEPLQ